MEENTVNVWIRRRLGLSIGPEGAAYLLRQAQRPAEGPVVLFGADARTGAPRQVLVDAGALREISQLASGA